MNYRLFCTILLSCIFSAQLLQAQNPSSATAGAVMSFSLDQAQTYAYENNYDLKNSSTDVEIAGKMVKQNTAIGLPQINAGIDYMDYLKTPTTVIPNFIPDPTGLAPKTLEVSFGVKYNVNAKATLTQLIYSGQYLVGLQTAKAYLETAKQKNLKDKVDVRDLVADAYVRLLVIDEALQILDSTYTVVNRLVDEARKSYQNGLIEDIDVEQADLNRINLEAQVKDTRNGRNLAYSSLKFLIGLKANQEMTLSDKLPFFLAQIDRDALINQPFDYRNNMDYTMLKKADYLVLMQYKLAKTAYHPTLAGFLSYAQGAQRMQWNFGKAGEPWFNTINWGASLTIPIWSSGSRKYTVDQARLNVEKTKVADEKVRVGLELQVETAKKDFSNAYSVYQNKKKGFDTALKIYEKTLAKYKMGVSSSTDLNQRYAQFLQSNGDYMMSIYTVLSSKIKLSKLMEKF
ncbi:MAG: TolC family protein [Bacteroidota bacterium]